MREKAERWEARDDAFLAAIVRSAGDAILAIDPAGRILSWNGGATRLFEYAADEMIGQPLRLMVRDDSRAALDSALDRLLAGKRCISVDLTGLTAARNPLAVTVALSPVCDEAGAVMAVSAIIRERVGQSAALEDGLASHVMADTINRTDALPQGARNILVVEDEALIGLGLSSMLENAGFDVIGPAADVFSAMDLIDRHGCALALLDIKLRSGETSAPLALWLKREGIPFFVTSGNLDDAPSAVFGNAPRFPKPVRAHAIVAAVQDALRQPMA